MPKEEMATQRFETTIEGGSGGDEVSTQDITGRDVYSAPLLVDARAITFVMCRREKAGSASSRKGAGGTRCNRLDRFGPRYPHQGPGSPRYDLRDEAIVHAAKVSGELLPPMAA